MNRQICICLLFFFCTAFVEASILPKDSVQVVANWKKGETYTYKVNRSVKEVDQGELINQYTTQATYSFHVMNATADIYTIRWTLHDIHLSNGAWDNPVVATILSFFEQVPIVYTTDNMGEFLEWQNWLEIKHKAPTVITEILNRNIRSHTSRDQSRQFIFDIMSQLFENREQAESSLLKEVIMLHGFHGYIYPLEEKTPYEDYLKTPHGKPIRANGFMRFHDFDRRSGHVEAEVAYTLDEKAFKKMIHEMMNKEGGNAHTDLPKQFNREYAKMKMENTKEEHYLINTYLGRVEKLLVTHNSVSVIEGKERVKYEKMELVLVE